MREVEGPARRAIRLAAVSAGVTGSYIGYLAQRAFLDDDEKSARLKRTHTKAARKVSNELMSLRGPAMKLGQALSLHHDVLPDEIIAELATLQMSAPGMHPSLVRAQFAGSLGKNPEELFKAFDATPFAAASLGQVHRATLESGEAVAVKIQYPGIQSAIANDFRWFRAVSKGAQLSRHLPTVVIDELEEQIVAECDYVREAKNIAVFRKALAPLDFVTLPRVYPRYSSNRVLTMSVVPGEHLDDFLARKPSQALRDRVGERLFELFYFQLLEMRTLHADPHSGNYLFGRDGTIGLVDFGCVKYFAPRFIDNISKLFLYDGARGTGHFEALLAERYIDAGTRLSPSAIRAFARLSEEFYGRVYPPKLETDETPIDFGEERIVRDYLRETTKVGLAKATLPEYVFLGRAESGLYQTLHRLRARVRTSAIVRKYLRNRRPASASG